MYQKEILKIVIFGIDYSRIPSVSPLARWKMVSLFRANEGTLAMKMVTLTSTVLLLQEMKISDILEIIR